MKTNSSDRKKKHALKWRRWTGGLVLFLLCAQAGVILLSWLLTAALPDTSLRSLLSSEGIRWFFGRATDNLCQPLLIWLLLLSIGLGAVKSSGLYAFMVTYLPFRLRDAEYRERVAFRFVLGELALVVLIMVLLTAMPHAILLSVTGHLYPGPFSSSLIPVISFTLMVMGVTFGEMSGVCHGIEEVLHLITAGIAEAAPLFILYLVGVQLYCSLLFVF